MINDIKKIGLTLPVGDSARMLCPWCEGGSTREQSLRITNYGEYIGYNCFRAKCKSYGDIPTHGVRRQITRPTKIRPFNKDLVALPDVLYENVFNHYEIPKETVELNEVRYCPELDRIYLPVFNPLGYPVGGVAKAYDKTVVPKSLTYIEEDYPLAGFSRGNCDYTSRPLIVVEDMISLLKCSLVNNSCCVLGCTLQKGVRDLILALSPTNIVVMMDGDDAGYAAAQRIYRAFKDFTVVSVFPMLKGYDPKDVPLQKLRQYGELF
jgi:hypothetical protein